MAKDRIGGAFVKGNLEHVGKLNSFDLSERIGMRPVENAQTLLGSLPYITTWASEQNILDIAPYVNHKRA